LKTLVLGGIKSGKSSFAETLALQSSTLKPYYLATTEFIDDEMQRKIAQHKKRRQEKFHTIEEPLELSSVIEKVEGTILVECVSMWLNNMLYHQKSDAEIFDEIESVLKSQNDIIFVLNDVSRSVVSDNALVRKFVDMSGILSQIIASECERVYSVTAGIGVQIK